MGELRPNLVWTSAEDAKYLSDKGFMTFGQGHTWLRRLPGRTHGVACHYIRFTERPKGPAGSWHAVTTNQFGSLAWHSPPFPDPITAFVYAEACQWQP